MNNSLCLIKLSFTGTILFMFFSSKIVLAQCNATCGSNLLPNPGFETSTSQCANPDNQIYSNLTPVDSWFGVESFDPNNAAGSTPDYFSPCGSNPGSTNLGCQTSDAMVGLFTRASFPSGRESLQAQLLSPLVAGKTYCFSMVVKSRVGAAGNILSQCDGIGAWFHNQGWIDIDAMNGGNQFIGPGSTINAQPQVENPSGNLIGSSCVTVTGTFCATGGEEWIVISNFRDDANTIITGSNPSNYMYIDEVKLFEVCDTLEIELSSPNVSIACGGSTTLIPQINTNLSPITYAWLPSGFGLAGGGTQLVAPTTNTNFTLIASATNACGLLISDTTQLEISVAACGLFFSLNDTSICEGTCITIQNPMATNGNPPYQYYWSGAYTAGDTICPTQNTALICTVVDSLGNSFSDTLNIYVNAIPTITLPNDTAICENQTLTIHANHNGAIIWSNNTNADSLVIQPANSAWYSATTSLNGCVTFDSIYVGVHTKPIFNLSATDVSCYGQMNGFIEITNLISNGVNQIEWSNGTLNQFSITQLAPGLYWSEIIDTNSCSHRDSIQINEPSEIIAGIGGEDSVCLGSTTELTALVSGGTSPYTYAWSNGNNSSQILFQPNSQQSITLIVTDQANCTDTISIDLFPLPIAEASFIGSDSSCSSVSVDFLNTSQNATQYQWHFSNGISANSVDATVSFSNPGCYDATLIALNDYGCHDTLFKPCIVQVYPRPQAILISHNQIVTELDPVVNFINNSIGADSCIFQAGNGLLFENCSNTYEVTYSNIGLYTATLLTYNAMGCADSTTISIEVIATPTLFVPNAFSPNGDGINDYFFPKGYGIESMELLIFNRWGELIFSSDNENYQWDGASCPVDVYVWKINYKDRNGNYHIEYGHVSLVK